VLVGSHDHALDAKNRLTVPARFRDALSRGAVISRGLEKCLEVHPVDRWEQHVEEQIPAGPKSREARELQRFLLHRAEFAELDAAGRLTLTPRLIDHAAITKECVVVGMRTHLEVWDRETWERHDEEVGAQAEDLANAVAAITTPRNGHQS
jgi:MraZ protein